MDYKAPGAINQSVMFSLDTSGATVSEFKITYTRWNNGDGTSFTKSTPTALTALASITTAHTDNQGIYMSAVADDGGKFLFRADFPDAAFASGAQMVICSLYDDLDEIIGQRIFSLEVDPSVIMNYFGEKGTGVYLDPGAANTNTVIGTDGTKGNPVSTFAAAKTLADSLNSKIIYCLGQTAVNAGLALGQDFVGYTFVGIESRGQFYVLLDGRDVERSRLFNLGIYGVQGGTEKAEAYDCVVADPGTGDTQIHMDLYRCQIAEEIKLLAATDHNWHDCYTMSETGSGAAASIVTLDFSNVGNIDAAINNFHGNLQISNAKSGDRVLLNGSGFFANPATNDDNWTLFISGAWDYDDQKGSFNNIEKRGTYYDQFVRDSMQLAATSGTGAAGSIDEAVVDAISEPAQGLPPVTPTFKQWLQWLWMTWRNQSTETAAVQSIRNDAGTVLAKRPTQSDDGVTFTNSKWVSGP